MKKRTLIKAITLLLVSSTSFAHQTSPTRSLFFGLGGSYNSVKVDQDLIGIGLSNVYAAGVLVSSGAAGGPAVDFRQTDTTFAPAAQFGFVSACNNGFWGLAFTYKYLGLTITHSPVNLPQAGAFVNTAAAPALTTFTGNAFIQSVQTRADHELELLAFVGQTFKQNDVYLGVGPALFLTKTNINNGIGFADVNGVHENVTGRPISFADDKWVWGGAAQIGISRYLSPTIVADLCYTFAMSANFKIRDHGEFSNLQTSTGYVTTGNIFVSNSQRLTAQSVTLTINKMFSL